MSLPGNLCRVDEQFDDGVDDDDNNDDDNTGGVDDGGKDDDHDDDGNTVYDLVNVNGSDMPALITTDDLASSTPNVVSNEAVREASHENRAVTSYSNVTDPSVDTGEKRFPDNDQLRQITDPSTTRVR